MWSKRTLFARKPYLCQRLVESGGQRCEARIGVNPGPEDAWGARVGEEARIAKTNLKWWGMHSGDSTLNAINIPHFAEKFQSDVIAFRGHKTNAGKATKIIDVRGDALANRGVDIECEEDTHRQISFLRTMSSAS